jgi:hypothetical protein
VPLVVLDCEEATEVLPFFHLSQQLAEVAAVVVMVAVAMVVLEVVVKKQLLHLVLALLEKVITEEREQLEIPQPPVAAAVVVPVGLVVTQLRALRPEQVVLEQTVLLAGRLWATPAAVEAVEVLVPAAAQEQHRMAVVTAAMVQHLELLEQPTEVVAVAVDLLLVLMPQEALV